MTSTASWGLTVKSPALQKRRYRGRVFYAFFFSLSLIAKRNAGRPNRNLTARVNPRWLNVLATRRTWRLVTLNVTGIRIRLNHLVSLIFARPGEIFDPSREEDWRWVSAIAWQCMWTLFWTQFKRRLTGRVNLASLMHYQPHDYIIDYLSKSIEKIDLCKYCPVFTTCIDKIARRICMRTILSLFLPLSFSSSLSSLVSPLVLPVPRNNHQPRFYCDVW